MEEFVACSVQIAVKPNKIEENVQKVIEWGKQAKHDFDADLLVYPETVSTGFLLE